MRLVGSFALFFFCNLGTSIAQSVLLNPSTTQTVSQPAGTSLAPNTIGGTGATGGVDFLSQFGSMSAAMSDASTYGRGVVNDSNVFGGFTNPNNISIVWPASLQQAKAGSITPEDYGAKGDGTTDDSTAIGTCMAVASAFHVVCVLTPASGTYYMSNYVFVPTHFTMRGAGSENNTIIKCGYAGFCFQTGPGVQQGVLMENFDFNCDPAFPACGFLRVNPSGSDASGDGMWQSKFRDMQIEVNQGQAFWFTGSASTSSSPFYINQFISFDNIAIYGYLGTHLQPLFEADGINNQFSWSHSSQINGDGSTADYPNALVLLKAISGYNDGPTMMNFGDISIQGGALGISTTFVAGLTWTGGYAEDLGTVLAAGLTTGIQVTSPQLNNDGFSSTGIFNLTGAASGVIEGASYGNSSLHPLTYFATCTNQNTVTFINNNNGSGAGISTSGCATTQSGISSNTVTTRSNETLVTGDGGASPVALLNGPTNPGEFNTFCAWGGAGLLVNNSSNLSFGNYASPMWLDSQTCATFRSFDLGLSWVLEGTNSSNVPAGIIIYGAPGGKTTNDYFIPVITSTNSDTIYSIPSIPKGTAGIPSGYACSDLGTWDASGTQFDDTATCHDLPGNTYIYQSVQKSPGSEAFVLIGGTNLSGLSQFSGLGQIAAGAYSQTCTITTGNTSCTTATYGQAFNSAPLCYATVQGTSGLGASCTVTLSSGFTYTAMAHLASTAAASTVVAIELRGNPN